MCTCTHNTCTHMLCTHIATYTCCSRVTGMHVCECTCNAPCTCMTMHARAMTHVYMHTHVTCVHCLWTSCMHAHKYMLTHAIHMCVCTSMHTRACLYRVHTCALCTSMHTHPPFDSLQELSHLSSTGPGGMRYSLVSQAHRENLGLCENQMQPRNQCRENTHRSHLHSTRNQSRWSMESLAGNRSEENSGEKRAPTIPSPWPQLLSRCG